MNGGAMESRTPDLRVANATLYQLSYDPTKEAPSVPAESQLVQRKAALAFHAVDAALCTGYDGFEKLRVMLAK